MKQVAIYRRYSGNFTISPTRGEYKISHQLQQCKTCMEEAGYIIEDESIYIDGFTWRPMIHDPEKLIIDRWARNDVDPELLNKQLRELGIEIREQ